MPYLEGGAEEPPGRWRWLTVDPLRTRPDEVLSVGVAGSIRGEDGGVRPEPRLCVEDLRRTCLRAGSTTFSEKKILLISELISLPKIIL